MNVFETVADLLSLKCSGMGCPSVATVQRYGYREGDTRFRLQFCQEHFTPGWEAVTTPYPEGEKE